MCCFWQEVPQSQYYATATAEWGTLREHAKGVAGVRGEWARRERCDGCMDWDGAEQRQARNGELRCDRPSVDAGQQMVQSDDGLS